MDNQEIQEVPLFKDDDVLYFQYHDDKQQFLEGKEEYDAQRMKFDYSSSCSENSLNELDKEEEINGKKITSILLQEDFYHSKPKEYESEDEEEYLQDINEDSDSSNQDIILYRKKLWKGGVNIEEITQKENKAVRCNQHSLRFSIHPADDGETKIMRQIGLQLRNQKEDIFIDSNKKTIDELLLDISQALQQSNHVLPKQPISNLFKRRLRQSTVYNLPLLSKHLSKPDNLQISPQSEKQVLFGKQVKLNFQNRLNISKILTNHNLPPKNINNGDLQQPSAQNTPENLSDLHKSQTATPQKDPKCILNKQNSHTSLVTQENHQLKDQICSQEPSQNTETITNSIQKESIQKRNPNFIRRKIHFQTSIIDVNHKVGALGEDLSPKKNICNQRTFAEFEQISDDEKKIPSSDQPCLNKIDENQEEEAATETKQSEKDVSPNQKELVKKDPVICFTPHGTLKTQNNKVKSKDNNQFFFPPTIKPLNENSSSFESKNENKIQSKIMKILSNESSPSQTRQKSHTTNSPFKKRDFLNHSKQGQQQISPFYKENFENIFAQKEQISPIKKQKNLFQNLILKQSDCKHLTIKEEVKQHQEEKIDQSVHFENQIQKEPMDPSKLFKEVPLHVIESRYYLKQISYFNEDNNVFRCRKEGANSEVLVMRNVSSQNTKKLRVYFFGYQDIYLDFLINITNTRIGDFESFVFSSFLAQKQSNRELLKWPDQPSHYRIFPSCGDLVEERFKPEMNIPELSEKMMLVEAIGEFIDYCCFVEVSDSYCESGSVSNINEIDPEHDLKEFQNVYSKQGELVFKVEWKEKEFSSVLRIGEEKTVGDLFMCIQKKKTIDIDKKYFVILGKMFGQDNLIVLDFKIPLKILDGKILKISKREYEDQQGSLKDDGKVIHSQNNNFCSHLETAEEQEESLNDSDSSSYVKQNYQQDSKEQVNGTNSPSDYLNNHFFQKRRGSKYQQLNQLEQIQLMKYEEFQMTKLYFKNNEVHKKSERVIGIDENSIYNRKVQSPYLNFKNFFCFLFPGSVYDTKNPVKNINDIRDMYLIEDTRILIQFQERGQIKNWTFSNTNSSVCKRIFQKLLFMREIQQVKFS